MKIAAYISGYRPETGGGFTFESEIFEALLGRCHKSRHSFAVLSGLSSQDALQKRLHGLPVTTHVVSKSKRQWLFEAVTRAASQRHRFGRRPTSLDRAMQDAGADLLWFVAQPAGPQWTDYPYITTVWDVQHRVTPWFPEMTASGEWENREWVNIPLLQRAAAVITGTMVGQAEIERYYQVSPERIARLPHPTPQFALDAAVKPVMPLPAEFDLHRPYIFYPAQLWAHKNHVNLLLALAEMANRGLEVPNLVLIGSDKGNKSHILAAAKAAGVAKYVRFLGFVSRSELTALYRHAAMLAYPSWFGPENLPPLEAFALGCPVAASDIPGAQEQLGDAALLFDPADPRDIADKITTMMTDTGLRERLIVAGRARAATWTAADYVDGVLAIADRLESPLRCWAR